MHSSNSSRLKYKHSIRNIFRLSFLIQDALIRANGSMENEKVKVYRLSLITVYMKDSGKPIRSMGKAK